LCLSRSELEHFGRDTNRQMRGFEQTMLGDLLNTKNNVVGSCRENDSVSE